MYSPKPLLIAALMATTGCSGQVATQLQPAAPAATDAAATTASSSANALLRSQARAALESRDAAAAVSFAELAVTGAPEDVEARKLLGQAYMAAGRFRSAAEAYGDARAIQDSDDLAFRQALALLASGSRNVAVVELNALAMRGAMAEDVGLALALAGEVARGTAILEAAARRADATARTRQNLALAQVLGGAWSQARSIVVQDLTPDQLEARIAQWSRLVGTADEAARTAALLAITPVRDDRGRPAALAYGATKVEPVAVAEQMPEPVPEAPPAKVQAPVQAAAVSTPAVRTGDWVVQLGAYSRLEQLEASWSRAVRQAPVLRDYEPQHSVTRVGQRQTLLRLSVGAFDRASDAIRLCETLRSNGSDCFVRRGGAEVLVRLVRTEGPPQA